MKSLIGTAVVQKIFPVANFSKLVPVFRQPPVTLKVVPKADFDMYIGENRPMTAKESWNWNLMQLSEKCLELENIYIFIESTRPRVFYRFFLNGLYKKK